MRERYGTGACFVDRFPVRARGKRDVRSILIAILNLDRRQPDLDDLRNLLERIQIAGR